jgi:hypothetical protein
MKNNYAVRVIVLFAFFISCSAVFASGPPKVILKFSPQHLIRNGLWLSGEFFNSDYKISHQFSAEGCYAEPYNTYKTQKFSGFTAEYMLRYYPNKMKRYLEPKDITKGMYCGVFCQSGSYIQKDIFNNNSGYATEDLKGVTFFPGFVFGFQQRLGDKMFVDIFGGAGMHKVMISNNATKYNTDTRYYGVFSGGVLPKIGILFGMGF